MNNAQKSQRTSSELLWAAASPELSPSDERPLLIYLHIPYCSSKCTFCDWVKEVPASHLRAETADRSRYVAAMASQIRHHGRCIMESGSIPRLIYWGGGTPTRLEPNELTTLCEALRDGFDLRAIEEQTVECSPETVTAAKLDVLARHGVTRLSIGAQSFDEEELHRAGRAHSSKQIGEAVAIARAIGFNDINLDLIAGFPGQHPLTLAESVEKAVRLDPSHVTVYVYRATGGTAMAEQLRRGKRDSSEYTGMLRAYQDAKAILLAAGYREYAIGYFTRDERRPCRADQFYFSIEGDYFGFGCGAHSVFAHHFFENAAAQQEEFIGDPFGFSGCERFSAVNVSRLLTSLSQTLWIPEGISFSRFESLYGFPFSALADHPHLRAFMTYYELCGAKFERTATHLRVTEETMIPAYIRALSRYGTQNEGRALTRIRLASANAS